MAKKLSYEELEQKVKELEEKAAKRKQAEKARNAIEKRYQIASVAGQVGVWDWDLKTGEIYLDPNLKAMLGYRDVEIRNHLDDWGKYVHPDDAEVVMNTAEAHLQGKVPNYEVTHRMLHKDGSIRWFLARGKAIRDAKGKPCRVLGTDTDITERKMVEVALKESEEKYRSLYASMNEGVALHEIIYSQSGDPVDYRILDVNEAFQSILGIKREQAIGIKASELYGTGDPPYIEIYTKVAQTGHPVSFETYFEPFDKHFSISVFSPERGKFATVFSDITEQKHADEELKKKIVELNSFINNIPDMAWLKDSKSRFIMANSAFGKAVGMAPESLTNETCEVCFGKERAKRSREDDLRVMQTRKQEIIEEKIVDSKKNEVWLETIKSPILDESGKVVGTVGVSRDITDRKRVEEALKESERRLHDLSSHLLSAQEKERRRIALELHDDLGQELSVLKLQIGSIERKLKKIPTTLEEDCDTVLRSVDQIIENVRRLSHDLSPSILEDLGLSAAIRSLIEDFRKYGRINVSIDTEKIDNLFSNEAQIVIYRIFQEALSNIVKHAQATHVSIAMERNDESVAFVIEDNGKGYDPEKVQRRSSAERGLGIPAIIERVRMLGGTLNLSSHESRGTSICFTLPIDKEGSVH